LENLNLNMEDEVYPFEDMFTYILVKKKILSLLSNKENEDKKCSDIINVVFNDIYGKSRADIENKNKYIFNTVTAIYVASMFSFYYEKNQKKIEDFFKQHSKDNKYQEFNEKRLKDFGHFGKKKNEKLGVFIKKLRISLAHHNVKFYKNNDIEFTNYHISGNGELTYKIKMNDKCFFAIIDLFTSFIFNYITLKNKEMNYEI